MSRLSIGGESIQVGGETYVKPYYESKVKDRLIRLHEKEAGLIRNNIKDLHKILLTQSYSILYTLFNLSTGSTV